ncbi:MAG TPA: adenylate/guanylate cyclase domain-containing protein, partial [Solirubrobacteraceae bacterium]|nr:adenylate/guanylate cyclase domain-containing protein [Solirubrobacteraceae bacterium]
MTEARMADEHGSVKLVTILLTDLVGSTQLFTSVGPARAEQLRDEHFTLIRDAIDRTGGEEFKNSGDGLWVAFASASAAVECAVLIQQSFERRYRRAEQRLHVRIGCSAGESTVRDGDYFGMPPVEAARLCDHAPADGILISAAVRLLAGRAQDVELESVGRLELKGMPEPIEAFAVSWRPLEPEAGAASELGGPPLPLVLRSVPSVAYVGRAEERALIERARDTARGGRRQVVLVSGEP